MFSGYTYGYGYGNGYGYSYYSTRPNEDGPYEEGSQSQKLDTGKAEALSQ